MFCKFLNIPDISVDQCSIEIGDNNYFNGNIYLNVYEHKTKILIGNECLFSNNVTFRTSDTHTMFDINTGKRLNNARDIIVGNHVWCGMDVFFQKGSKVSNNSVVGAKSLVTKNFDEENICIAGVPARIIHHSINWTKSNTLQEPTC